MSNCKYCQAEIIWKNKKPFNPDGSQHSSKIGDKWICVDKNGNEIPRGQVPFPPTSSLDKEQTKLPPQPSLDVPLEVQILTALGALNNKIDEMQTVLMLIKSKLGG